MSADKPLGFWSCWSLTVGTMIGSGIFMLPTVLAPYGLLSFGGWLLAGGGSIVLALVMGRLAARTTRTGGPYTYARDAFGDFVGFIMAWGYWASYWIALPAIAIAFTAYLTVFWPALADSAVAQALTSLALIWALTLTNIRGLREASFIQLAMTLLKIVPLLAIIALGAFNGAPEHLPPFNPGNQPIATVLAATAVLTMWAFAGFESGCIPASNVRDAQTCIPRAVVIGTITVTVIYLASTAAVMALVPRDILLTSTSPFADAARGLGAWGPALIAIGALIATAGSLNGNVFVAGQLPMAVALDNLAPRALARTNDGGSPYISLIIAATLASVLLLMNYTRGLVGAFTFMALMSTTASLAALLVSALAELRNSWRSAKSWALLALVGAGFAVFAILGSGLEVAAWGVVMFASGAPLYVLMRRTQTPAPAT